MFAGRTVLLACSKSGVHIILCSSDVCPYFCKFYSGMLFIISYSRCNDDFFQYIIIEFAACDENVTHYLTKKSITVKNSLKQPNKVFGNKPKSNSHFRTNPIKNRFRAWRHYGILQYAAN